MKPLKNSKISTLILWVCMIVSFGVFSAYYYGLFTHPGNMDTAETSVLLNWLYILFSICLLSAVVFSVIQMVKLWKTNRKQLFYSLTGVAALGIVLFISYLMGSGEPLPVSGSEGNDNMFLWLKITDMWIYSIYILLAVSIVAVIAGILWSYIKKTR
ncbi:MAG: hypothetical protein LIO93_01365 [Bacteroidales bacterium]|nr:hypothetical protein [Bacteroidales bacterium]